MLASFQGWGSVRRGERIRIETFGVVSRETQEENR